MKQKEKVIPFPSYMREKLEFIKNSKYSDNTKDQIMLYSELYYKLNDIIEENEMQIKITQKEKTK